MTHSMPMERFFKEIGPYGWQNFTHSIDFSNAILDAEKTWQIIHGVLMDDYGAIFDAEKEIVSFRAESDFLVFKLKWS